MATDNLMPQSSTSIIKHLMLRSSTTGQGLTGKVAADFSGKYNIAGGAEVTLSFSSGSAGDAYSSGKIVPLGLGKYAWHVPDAVFASLGNVSAVLSVTGGIDVHCEWLVVAAVRDTAAFGANVTAPATPTNVSDAKDAILAKLPESGRAATPADVSPTLNFSPTIEPTELSPESVSAIQSGLALESSVQSVITTLSEGVVLDSATLTKIDDILTDTGTTLPAQIAGIEGGGGGLTGPYTRTITVTDTDTDEPIEGAKVRLYRTGETGTLATDVDGVASFTVEAATWSYAVAASGYAGASGTAVVSANGNTDVQLVANVITPPATPGLSAIVVLCLDAAGQPEADVDVDIRIVTVPSGSQNTAFKGAKQAATSDADGIARFEVVQGSVCEWKRGKADVWSRVTIDSDSVTNVTSVIGSP
jgi:hypothetical protein